MPHLSVLVFDVEDVEVKCSVKLPHPWTDSMFIRNVTREMERVQRKVGRSPWAEPRRWRHELERIRSWWLSPHRPFQPVFVITSARTGSNLLMQYLGQFPGAQCLGEVLNSALDCGPPRGIGPLRAIQHVRRSLQTLNTPVRACKLFLIHLARYRLTLPLLDDAFPGAKYIVLYRESIAEQFVSRQLALQTGQWLLHGSHRQKQLPVVVDRDQFTRFAEELQQGYCEILSYPWLPERATCLSYEMLTQDPGRCLKSHICPLLSAPSIKPHAHLRKQNPEPLSARVANYAEVSGLLEGPLCRQHYELPSRNTVARAA